MPGGSQMFFADGSEQEPNVGGKLFPRTSRARKPSLEPFAASKKQRTMTPPRRAFASNEVNTEDDELTREARNTARAIVAKRREVTARKRNTLIQSLSNHFEAQLDDVRRALSKASSSTVAKIQKAADEMAAQRAEMYDGLGALESQYQQELFRGWESYRDLVHKQDARLKQLAVQAHKEEVERVDQRLNELVHSVTSSLDKAEAHLNATEEKQRGDETSISALLTALMDDINDKSP